MGNGGIMTLWICNTKERLFFSPLLASSEVALHTKEPAASRKVKLLQEGGEEKELHLERWWLKWEHWGEIHSHGREMHTAMWMSCEPGQLQRELLWAFGYSQWWCSQHTSAPLKHLPVPKNTRSSNEVLQLTRCFGVRESLSDPFNNFK